MKLVFHILFQFSVSSFPTPPPPPPQANHGGKAHVLERVWLGWSLQSPISLLKVTSQFLYYIQRKILIFFRRSFFLYSPCPNLEGIKDTLFYEFRRPMIGQNCSAVCTNKGGRGDAFSLEQMARFERPAQQATATEPRAKRETRSVLRHSLVVDSTDVAIAVAGFEQCYLPASRGVVYEVILIGSKFVLLQL